MQKEYLILEYLFTKNFRKKSEKIYSFILNFGGYLGKANSEGQPGPQKYGRSHADGIRFDPFPFGNNVVGQYNLPVAQKYGSSETCPEKLLLWFHHLD